MGGSRLSFITSRGVIMQLLYPLFDELIFILYFLGLFTFTPAVWRQISCKNQFCVIM